MHTISEDQNKLIKSYGFIEEIMSNKSFLQDSIELASNITGVPMSYISLIDNDYQYVISQHSTSLKTIDVTHSICQYTVKDKTLLEIEDTHADIKTQDLPVVLDEDIRFYCGAPLLNSEGNAIGALCVVDSKTHSLTYMQKEALALVGKQIMTKLDQQRELIKLIKNINKNFEPSNCSDINCLRSELTHLHEAVVKQNQVIKNQKKQLQSINNNLSTFAEMVAHDVKAPLRNIKGFLSIIEDKVKLGPDYLDQKYFEIINASTTNLETLIDDILIFTRAGSDVEEFNSSIDLRSLINDVEINLANNILTQQAQITYPTDLLQVRGHRSSILSLFQNIISNGLKYQREDSVPHIVITAEQVDNRYLISISDNGIGIPKEYFKEITKPFVRLHSSKAYPGTGFGLATCKKILNQMGTKLNVTSELGKGSTFSFHLPLL